MGLQITDYNKTLIQFLPGQYSSSVVQSLSIQKYLNSQTSIFSTPGYDLSSAVPPFNITLQPGFVIFADRNYSGAAIFISLRVSFSNQSIPLLENRSIAIATDVYLVISDGSKTIILYETAPFFPSTDQPFAVVDYQSSTCQPPCSSHGVCTAFGKCACDEGFTGSSCEFRVSGLVGRGCKPWLSSCEDCDQISGECLTPKTFDVKRREHTCTTSNCRNGQCGADGKCSCLPGWTNDACTQPAPGFFLTSTGNSQGKILCISFFSPSDNSQYVNLDALSVKISRESAFLVTMVSA